MGPGIVGSLVPMVPGDYVVLCLQVCEKDKIVGPALADLDSGRWIPKEEDLDDRPRPKWKKVLARFV